MKCVRRFSALIPVLLLVSFAHSQSLSEVAKKEKERRKKVGEKTEVITEKELSRAEGENVSSMGEAAGSSEPEGAWEKKETSAYEEMKERDALRDRETFDKWTVERQKFAQGLSMARSHVAASEQAFERECTGKKRKDPNLTSAGLWGQCNRYKEQIKEAKKELRRIQSDCMDAARKLGMLPSRARASCGS